MVAYLLLPNSQTELDCVHAPESYFRPNILVSTTYKVRAISYIGSPVPDATPPIAINRLDRLTFSRDEM